MASKILSLRQPGEINTEELLPNEVPVALSTATLEKLIRLGVLSPSEVRPLNDLAKMQIKRFCLSACQGRDCHSCVFQHKCHFMHSK